jgi:CheY-like chemotaxis protein
MDMRRRSQLLMLVENDPYFIYLLRLYAEQSGFRVISTSAGHEVLAIAKRERPTVIVLDLDLPEVDGADVLSALRSDPLTQEIPVVICIWADDKQGFEVGEAEYLLRKPMRYDHFLTALRDIGLSPLDHPGKGWHSWSS